MQVSSNRFKSLAVTFGFSFWFFIITTTLDIFSFETFGIFVAIVFIITQIFSKKLSRALDIFAKFNTKIFLGILYICVISLYGILFRVLRIDLLRLKKNSKTYWLDMEKTSIDRILKQF